MSTRVFSLRTGKEVGEYSLAPRQALIAAHEQARGNYNTWDYPEDSTGIETGRAYLFLGDFAVRYCDGGVA